MRSAALLPCKIITKGERDGRVAIATACAFHKWQQKIYQEVRKGDEHARQPHRAFSHSFSGKCLVPSARQSFSSLRHNVVRYLEWISDLIFCRQGGDRSDGAWIFMIILYVVLLIERDPCLFWYGVFFSHQCNGTQRKRLRKVFKKVEIKKRAFIKQAINSLRKTGSNKHVW